MPQTFLKRNLKLKKRYIFLALSVVYLLILFSKLRSNKESFNNIVHHRALKRGQYGLISKRNKRFNVMLFWADYYLRWRRLAIEERLPQNRFG